MVGPLRRGEPEHAARSPLVDTGGIGYRLAAVLLAAVLNRRGRLLPTIGKQRQVVDAVLGMTEGLSTLVRGLVALDPLLQQRGRLLEAEDLPEERLAARPHRSEQQGIDLAPARFERRGFQIGEPTTRLR
ncbi:hypothetical protein NN4_12530 [Nocardia ninae NBRC 108245]|uniref:Uncharacterized protein n=1 Tax=Nocardia ninae NBRC 108245 TaxID=1210091 RepID=A0A511M7V7_9NOCA|nr:hypothetical protein NN4_12530 [Nocardia ninae NBRC 108245]